MKTTITSVGQEIKDFKSEALGDLREIKEHLKTLNGKVADNCLKINTVNVQQENCQAKKYHEDVVTKKDWNMIIVSFVTAVVVVGLTQLLNKIWS